MKQELDFFTYQVECKNLTEEHFLPFEATRREYSLGDWAKVDIRRPTFCMFRIESVTDPIWEEIKEIQRRKQNVLFLAVLTKAEFALAEKVVEHRLSALSLWESPCEEKYAKIEICMRRLAVIERILHEQSKLEDYQFENRRKVLNPVFDHALLHPEQMEYLLPEINRRYSLRFTETNYCAVVISVDKPEVFASEMGFFKAVTISALHYMSSARELLFGIRTPYGLIGLINYEEGYDPKVAREELVHLYEVLKNISREEGNFKVSMAVGCVRRKLSDFANSLIEAAYSQEYRMVQEGILFVEDLSPAVRASLDQPLQEIVPHRFLMDLSRSMMMCEEERIKQWFVEFYEKQEPKFVSNPPCYAKLCLWCYGVAEKIKDYPLLKIANLQHIFEGRKRMEELERILLEGCKGQHISSQAIAPRAIAYMKEHFREPLSLEELAEHCGVSSSHFSRRFKEEAGEKYIDVLTDLRMKHAMELLADSSLSVSEIMEEVGYCDDKHFRRLFEKHTGMTPRSYRKERKNF